MEFIISEKIKQVVPALRLGVIQCSVSVVDKDILLWNELLDTQKQILKTFNKNDIKNIPEIKNAREGYKKLGRNPDRYPLSSEALLKRILLNKEPYQINNLVDINNLVSIRTYFSIGLYNIQKISGDIVFDLGKEGELYESLGKGTFEINNLPVFRDAIGPFGSPTNDSKRTCITLGTTNIVMIIISFSGLNKLEETLNFSTQLLEQYASGSNIKTEIFS